MKSVSVLVINCTKNNSNFWIKTNKSEKKNIEKTNRIYMQSVSVFKIKNESWQNKRKRKCLDKNKSLFSSSYFFIGLDSVNVLLCSIKTLKRLCNISAAK